MARPKNQVARRAQLVQSAKQAIAERGLTGLRAIDVAAYSELGAGSVAYYYPDLSELVREVHQDAVSRFYWSRKGVGEGVVGGAGEAPDAAGAGDAAGPVAGREEQDPRARLVGMIRSGIPSSRDDLDFQVLNELHTHAYRDEFHAELMAELYRLEVSLYAEVLAEGESAGVFEMRLPVDTAASNLVALEDAYALHLMGGTPLETEQIFALIIANAEVMTGCALR